MMQEQKTLAQLMKEDEGKEVTESEASAHVEPQKDNEKLPPSRQGKRPYTIWIPEDAHKVIRVLAAEDDISQEQVGRNALNAYLRQLGRPPIA